MNIKFDICFILAAGMGTRMGNIGNILPKPLWPINDKVLIDLQIAYAKKLGAKKIFINTHYKAREIKKYVEHFHKGIELIFEEELLDMGAIENLKNFMKTGKVLILNSDQLLFFENDFHLLSGFSANLLCVPADPNEKYNKTILQDGQVIGIEVYHEKLMNYFTYSGVSLIDLDYIVEGRSPRKLFYQTLDFKKQKIQATTLLDFEYFDFGTKQRYIKSIFRLNDNVAKKVDSHSTKFFENNLKFNTSTSNEFYMEKNWCQTLKECFGYSLELKKVSGGYHLALGGQVDEVSC